MSTLAKALQAQGHRLANPIELVNKDRAKQGLSLLTDTDPVQGGIQIAESSSDTSSEEEEEVLSDEEASSVEASEEEAMPSYRSPKKTPSKSAHRAMGSPGGHVVMGTNSPTGPACLMNGDMNPIPYPMMSGYWEKVDFVTFEATGNVMIKMVIHNGINNVTDIEAIWQSPTLLKIRLRWPDWFGSVLQMLDFDQTSVNGNSVPTYGRDHPLTLSLAKGVGARMNEQREVWDEGYLSFERAMDQDNDNLEVEILDVAVGQCKVRLLQIIAQEAKDVPKKQKAKVKSRSVKTSSSSGKNHPNVRNREEVEAYMSEDEVSHDGIEVDSPKDNKKKKAKKVNQFTNQISTAIVTTNDNEKMSDVDDDDSDDYDDDEFSFGSDHSGF